jgi:hypothetical protein
MRPRRTEPKDAAHPAADDVAAPARPRERFHGRVVSDEPRCCQWAGCQEAGEFRAPKSPRQTSSADPKDYQWFCLDHVRAFNAAYDYFKGLSPEEIAALQRGHPAWDRATRPFASNANVWGDPAAEILDPLDLFARQRAAKPSTTARRPDGTLLTPEDLRALKALGLDETATDRDIRTRYKQLLKRYHPDQNGGDRAHEAKLQSVLQAYGRISPLLARR